MNRNKDILERTKAFVGVRDNDWFLFLSQQPWIDEVNILPKTALSKNR